MLADEALLARLSAAVPGGDSAPSESRDGTSAGMSRVRAGGGIAIVGQR